MKQNPAQTLISPVEFDQRLQKVVEEVRRRALSGLLAISAYQEREGHVAYLVDHHNATMNTLSHQGLGYAVLVVSASAEKALVTPLDIAFNGDSLVHELVKAVRALNLDEGKLGIAGMDILPVEYYLDLQRKLPKIEFIVADEMLETLRLVKSPDEIGILRRAAQVADAGLQAGLLAAQPGISGHDIELAIRQALLHHGADVVSKVQVCSGKSISSRQWPPVPSARIEDGDLVFLDINGWYAGYAFGCSRVKVSGQATPEQEAFLHLCTEVTAWMAGALKPGQKNTFYQAEARGFDISPYAHGIGLETAEAPLIAAGRTFNAEPGMVLYLAPVVSCEKFGNAAVGSMVLLTENSVEMLSQLD
jgi:Xaa-Pro aminopeptidase